MQRTKMEYPWDIFVVVDYPLRIIKDIFSKKYFLFGGSPLSEVLSIIREFSENLLTSWSIDLSESWIW